MWQEAACKALERVYGIHAAGARAGAAPAAAADTAATGEAGDDAVASSLSTPALAALAATARDAVEGREALSDLRPTFREAHARGMGQLCTSLTQRLRPKLDLMQGTAYDVDESAMAQAGEHGEGSGVVHPATRPADACSAFVDAVRESVEAQLGALRPLLTPENMETLASSLARAVADRVEAILWQKRVSQVRLAPPRPFCTCPRPPCSSRRAHSD